MTIERSTFDAIAAEQPAADVTAWLAIMLIAVDCPTRLTVTPAICALDTCPGAGTPATPGARENCCNCSWWECKTADVRWCGWPPTGAGGGARAMDGIP